MRTGSPREILLAVFLVCLVPLPILARSHNAPRDVTPTEPGYVLALAAANRFLYAWQTGDLENGMVLLSDGVRQSQNADRLENFFAGANKAFEIGPGHGNRDRYNFPVVLVRSHGSHVVRTSSELVLISASKDDWVVDRLP